jgi:hypothetical protein
VDSLPLASAVSRNSRASKRRSTNPATTIIEIRFPTHLVEYNDNGTDEHDNVQRVLDFAATLCQQQESKVPPPMDSAVEQER